MLISALYGRFFAPYLLRKKLARLGKNPRVAGWITVRGGDNVEVGDDFFTGPDFYLSTSRYSKVIVGDAVMLGPEVMILGGNHDCSFTKSHMRFNQEEDLQAKDIVIASGSWIGARSVILSGAFLGEGAVVGACSVVNKYVPPYCIAVGNSFRVVGPRFNSIDDLKACLDNTSSSYSLTDIVEIYAKYGFELN